MPLLLLSKLRLPTRGEAALAGAFALVLLFASWLRRGEKIAALEAQLAARPSVESHKRSETKKRTGPKRTETRTTISPDGTKTIDRVETIESQETNTRAESESISKPVQAYTTPRWLVGAATSPLDRSALSAFAGATIGGRLDLTVGWDFYGESKTRPRIGAAWRF